MCRNNERIIPLETKSTKEKQAKKNVKKSLKSRQNPFRICVEEKVAQVFMFKERFIEKRVKQWEIHHRNVRRAESVEVCPTPRNKGNKRTNERTQSLNTLDETVAVRIVFLSNIKARKTFFRWLKLS